MRTTVPDTALTVLKRFKHEIENLEKAAGRITASAVSTVYGDGKEPAAVAWLLKFLKTDLATLNEWQQEEMRWEVRRFSLDGGQGTLAFGGKANWGMGALGLKYPESAVDWLTTLKKLQWECREVLYTYLLNGRGTFPPVTGTVSIFNAEAVPRWRGETLDAGFYFIAAQLLAKYGHRVKECEGCAVLMLIGRKDQRFHSKSCQVASFFRNKRATDKAALLAKAHAKKSRMKRNKKKVAPQRKRGGTRHGTKR